MKLKWTQAQHEAVYAPVSDILVTAAAGSGKTQVLTGRIIERILGGADITRLLVVTFTKAAAAEMRARISESLSDALRRDPGNAHIRKQLSYLSGAHIMTIHSFCMDVIKQFFYFADLSAGFRICDAAEEKLLLSEATDEALEQLCTEQDENFIAFADSFSSQRNDAALAELGSSLYYFADSMPYPKEWLEKQPLLYKMETAEDFCKSTICETILMSAWQKLDSARELLVFAKKLCEQESTLSDYCTMFANDIECVDRIINHSENYTAMREALNEFKLAKRSGAKDAPSELKDRVAEIRDKAKKIITDNIRAKSFCFSAEENAQIMHGAMPIITGAIMLVDRMTEIYTEKKRKKNLLDYSDMLHITLSLLDDNGSPSAAAQELRSNFDEIYIDEYQDTGETEERIFSLISGRSKDEPNIFMVGDLKQSIYGFRQSGTSLFAGKKETYKVGDEKYRKISLTKNFRSSPAVIDFINQVFTMLFSKKFGGVEYDGEEKLVVGTEYPEITYPIEVAVIDTVSVPEQDGEDEEIDITSVEAEAYFVADKIHSMVGKELVYDAKRGISRPMRYSDISVLLRTMKRTGQVFEKVLTDAGIPVYCDKSGGFFETTEINSILSLMSVIDNPRDDIPLISSLRIPTIGFDENMLAEVRSCKKRGDFFDALKLCATKDSPTGNACAQFLKKLDRWRFLSEQLPCDELIELLLDETGYMDFALSVPGGEMRAANMRLFVEMARQFEKTSFRGLFNFKNYIDKTKDKGDSGTAKIIGEGHDVVRIMSIHKSKGLEFPVVFLCACEKRFNRQDEIKKMIFHKRLGTGTEFVDRELFCKYPTPAKAAVAAAIRSDNDAEELRVLYVALTRAKERLIVTSASKNPEKTFASWRTNLMLAKSGDCTFASSFMDWIGACLYSMNCPSLPEWDGDGTGREILLNVHQMGVSSAENTESCVQQESYDENDLCSSLLYSYPNKVLADIPSKISVSEMKRLHSEEENEFLYNPFSTLPVKKPRFIKETATLSPAEKGTLVHFVMQTIPLPVHGTDEVCSHIKSLTDRHIISEADAKEIPADKIAAFFESAVGKRMCSAQRIMREKPFTDYIPASFISGNTDCSDEKVLVQGIIDCCFFENDKIVLVDYKTDKVSDKEAIKEKYRIQIETYATFLEKKYSKKCEKIIYLFDIDDIIYYN